jgi:hypothetical protein
LQLPVAVHASHAPLLHTSPAPHVVPLPAFPVDLHVVCPVAHDVVPVWQRLPPGLQGVPAVQGEQAPLSQTSFAPQVVPSGRLVAPTHVVDPVAHDVVPVAQMLPLGLQVAPATHAPHWPPLHT